MAVTKSMRECYEIREDRGEWANITLHCWDNPPQPGSTRTTMYYCGEITINSTFGTWGNIWTACASPFKKFLLDADFDYLFTKFMGTALDRFDGEASAREVVRWILDERRHNLISRNEAREVMDFWEGHGSMHHSSEHEFGTAMMDVARDIGDRHPMHDHFADPCGWPRLTRYDYQAEGFWKKLWPLFTEALRKEIAETTQQGAMA